MEMMEAKNITLNSVNNNIKLYVLSDLHLGDPNCDLDKANEVITFIKDTPECYCILLGDIMNTATKNSKSDIYSETLSIAETQNKAKELFTPIKDKIIAIIDGNHEDRVWREVGLNLTLWLAQSLGLEDKYCGDWLSMVIKFGADSNNRPYIIKIAGQHGGYGAGRKLGSALNATEDLDGIINNADLYIRAHTHQPVQGSRKVYEFNEKGRLVPRLKYYYTAPSFLDYGGYGRVKGYKPSDNSPCYLNIRGVCKRKGVNLEKALKIDKVML